MLGNYPWYCSWSTNTSQSSERSLVKWNTQIFILGNKVRSRNKLAKLYIRWSMSTLFFFFSFLTLEKTALEGMRCAIMTGDIRAIYLLLWAGIRIRYDWAFGLDLTHFHPNWLICLRSGVNHMINQVVDGRKLLVWAPQNAGGNVFAVLNHLYTLTHNVISENYKMEILNELSEMKVRAHKRNQANLSWILPLNYLMRELMGPSNW